MKDSDKLFNESTIRITNLCSGLDMVTIETLYQAFKERLIDELQEEGQIKKSTRFKRPTLEQVEAYCIERNNTVDAQSFIDHYETNNWMRGRTKIKDWKACVRTWERNSGVTHSQAKEYSKVTEQNLINLDGWENE